MPIRTGSSEVVKSFSKIREKLGNKIKKALELTPRALASLKERLSPSGCGEVLKATKEYTDLSKKMGNPDMEEREDFEICWYWIESPPNTQIEVRIDGISGDLAVDGCQYHGVEIKSQKDQMATGYRQELLFGLNN
ncbi:hypothetical protein ANCCAN_01075 [Ancylostoma caninum]|uniref:CUB domain-containing protein n=1 Tax=Ancylostoma caninum TaxID=29170 RepID=A0A368HAP7_ANCCA|nr:hypothetical protein ANCCAN_01075 [Ancylostoma caninum]